MLGFAYWMGGGGWVLAQDNFVLISFLLSATGKYSSAFLDFYQGKYFAETIEFCIGK